VPHGSRHRNCAWSRPKHGQPRIKKLQISENPPSRGRSPDSAGDLLPQNSSGGEHAAEKAASRRLRQLAHERQRFGYRRLDVRLRWEGFWLAPAWRCAPFGKNTA
jgi:hypothetical protein